MALSTRLELRQSQQLVMTPQLQQAIKLLQLSNLELADYVDGELERNPLLERDEQADLPDRRGERDEQAEGPKRDSEDAPLELSGPVTDATATLDTDYENVYPEAETTERQMAGPSSEWASLRQRGNAPAEDSDFEEYTASVPTLQDHLAAQLSLAITDPVDRLIGQYLVDMVDEAGYLRGDLYELADKIGADPDRVASVLGVLQSFDPAGVFARDLKECLALQLKDRNRYDPIMARLIDNLHLLAARDFNALRRAVDVDFDEIVEMVSEVKQLNPKPGLQFGSVQVQLVVPDVFVRPANDGTWRVELNSDTLPRVLVNRSYYANVSRNSKSEGDRSYLMDCLQSANWLVKSLDQRARTILKVAEEIVRQQDAFLTLGVQYLRPLNLKTIADAISMHESTVSRVTSNKYMATPRGILEFKYFFTSSIAATDGGEAQSSEAVKHRIKLLIDSEQPKAVLSDDAIVEILQKDGIDIARRTVAKYREAMRIPSSVQRRRDKKLVAAAEKAMQAAR